MDSLTGKAFVTSPNPSLPSNCFVPEKPHAIPTTKRRTMELHNRIIQSPSSSSSSGVQIAQSNKCAARNVTRIDPLDPTDSKLWFCLIKFISLSLQRKWVASDRHWFGLLRSVRNRVSMTRIKRRWRPFFRKTGQNSPARTVRGCSST